MIAAASLLRSQRWQALALAFAALIMPLAAAGCSKHGKAAPVGGSDIPPSKVNLKRNVELARAEQRHLVYHVETVGVLEAEGQTDIAAGVSGIVDGVLFREGDQVDPNRTLVKVDQRRYVSAAAVAEANVRHAENGVKLAEDQYRRALRAGAGASPEEQTKAVLNQAMAQSELQSARASLEMARNNLDRSRVRPPYAGRINQRKVTPGTYLEDKTVIATIADLTRIRLLGYVPETAAPVMRDLMVGQDARLKLIRLTLPLGGFLAGPTPWAGCAGTALVARDQIPSGFDPEFILLAYPKRTFRGRVFYLSTVANPDTHMFEFKAEVDTRGLDVELRPGYTARIRIPLKTNTEAVVIPEEAVRASERGFIAFVPMLRKGPEGRSEWFARARILDTGYRPPGWVEVRQGVQPEEWIVRRGAEALEDGTPIQFPKDQGPTAEGE